MGKIHRGPGVRDIEKRWVGEHGKAVGEIEERVLIPTDHTP